MNLGVMKTELNQMVQESSLQALLADWINYAITEVAADFELPPLKLITPVTLTVDTSKWLWLLPSTFHKKLFRAKYADSDGRLWDIQHYDRIEDLLDRDHLETASQVREVAVGVQGRDRYLGIYPMAAQNLSLWYYRKPAVLVQDSDEPDCIPEGFEARLIYPRVITRNYDVIVDQVLDFSFTNGPLQLWESRKAQGNEALKAYMAKNYNKPRRHGGADPIGPGRRYHRGWF